MASKIITLDSLGVFVTEMTINYVIMEKDGMYIKYLRHYYDTWHHDNVMKDVLDEFKKLEKQRNPTPVVITPLEQRKKDIRKNLGI